MLLELKNILKNIKISSINKFVKEITKTRSLSYMSTLSYPSIHERISEIINNIKNKKDLYKIKEKLQYTEKRKQELIPKYKERMIKVIESMYPEKKQKSPTQKILEKLKIK